MDFSFSRHFRFKAPLRGDTVPIIGRLWRDWVRPHRATILAILAFIGLASGANALYPLLVREAFKALELRDFDALRYAPVIVIAVTALKGGALLMIARLTNGFVSRVEADLQHALYSHLIDADLARLQRESTAALTQRFTTDFAYIREALTRLFTVLVRDLAMLIGLVGVLLYLDPWSTLVAGLVAPFVVPPIARIGKRLRRIAVATQEETGQMAARVSESLAGARTAKAFRLEAYLKGRARDTFEQIRDLKMKGANARARLEPILEAGAGVAVAAVIVFVGWRLKTGEATLGDFAAYTGALLMAAQPARTIGNLNAILQEALAALERTFAVLDEAPSISDLADARPLAVREGAIAFEAVRFAYDAERPALAEVSVALPSGKTTAIVGPSGSGKSTFLALLSRFIEPQAGRITIDGQDIGSVTLASLRDQIALVSQDVALFDDTVAANIGFGRPGASEAEIVKAAEAAGAHLFISALPQGYRTRVGERGDRLSGGERQRIAIARAFLRDAPILLLDEATSALDAQSEDVVQAALGDLMRGRTTVVVAHRLSTVRHAALILVFEGGRIVEQGNHEALIARGGLYADLCRRQFSS